MLLSSAVSILIYGVWFSKRIASGTGTVKYLDLELGFYGIFSDDGEHYDPVNLDEEFKVDGLRVRFTAKILESQFSFHMWGKLVSIIYVQKL